MANFRTGSSTIVGEAGRWKNVRFTGLPLPALPAKLKEAQQEAMTDLAFYWRREHGPRHFHIRAFSAYGGREPRVYEKRKYMEKLDQAYGNTAHLEGAARARFFRGGAPLMKTGELKSRFLNGAMETRPTGARSNVKVRVVFRGLPKHTFYTKTRSGAQSHDKVRELTIMNEQDQTDLARRYQNQIAPLINN